MSLLTPAGSTTDQRAPSQQTVALVVVALAAAAWAVLALTHGTALDHQALATTTAAAPPHHGHSAVTDAPGRSPLLAGLLVVSGWAVMVVAMMLPPALPLLQTLRRLAGRHRHPAALVGLGAVVFVAVWALTGALLVAGDAGLHGLVERAGWQERAQAYVAGGVLAGAGLYQLTPLKRACLRACRSPRSFALAHWQGRRPAAVETTLLSASYGVSCVGCCWALMATSLAVGATTVWVMVALAVVMAAERLVSWGRQLVTPVAGALILLGALTFVGLLPSAGS